MLWCRMIFGKSIFTRCTIHYCVWWPQWRSISLTSISKIQAWFSLETFSTNAVWWNGFNPRAETKSERTSVKSHFLTLFIYWREIIRKHHNKCLDTIIISGIERYISVFSNSFEPIPCIIINCCNYLSCTLIMWEIPLNCGKISSNFVCQSQFSTIVYHDYLFTKTHFL